MMNRILNLFMKQFSQLILNPQPQNPPKPARWRGYFAYVKSVLNEEFGI